MLHRSSVSLQNLMASITKPDLQGNGKAEHAVGFVKNLLKTQWSTLGSAIIPNHPSPIMQLLTAQLLMGHGMMSSIIYPNSNTDTHSKVAWFDWISQSGWQIQAKIEETVW